jgi:hypothetical protein
LAESDHQHTTVKALGFTCPVASRCRLKNWNALVSLGSKGDKSVALVYVCFIASSGYGFIKPEVRPALQISLMSVVQRLNTCTPRHP